MSILFIFYGNGKIADTSNTINTKMKTARYNKSDKTLAFFRSSLK